MVEYELCTKVHIGDDDDDTFEEEKKFEDASFVSFEEEVRPYTDTTTNGRNSKETSENKVKNMKCHVLAKGQCHVKSKKKIT